MGGTAQQLFDLLSIMISVVAVLVSLGLGLSSRRTARRALRISERAEARLMPHFDLYLQDAAVWTSPRDATREYGVHLRITNPTDLPTAVVVAELHISYSRADHTAAVKVPTANAPQFVGDIDTIELPRSLQANDATSGWMIFHVPEELLSKTDVQRYDLEVRDVHDVIRSVQILMFPEKPHAK